MSCKCFHTPSTLSHFVILQPQTSMLQWFYFRDQQVCSKKKTTKKNIFLVLHNYAQFCFGLSQKTKDMEQIKIQIKTKYDTIQVYSDWPKVHVIQAQATLLAQEKVKGASYTFRKNMQETFTFWLLYVWVFLFLFCREMSWDHICCKLVLYN